jgi:hypothetical protein
VTPTIDIAALVFALRRVRGRVFPGVVDGGDCLELVFDGEEGNLVSLYFAGPRAGCVEFGGVAGPSNYVESYEEHRRSEATS